MAKKIPKFSYTGAYETSSDDTYWYIKLKSSGQMTSTYRKRIEVGCVGGGGGTISNRNYAHVGGFAGGGGGYIKTGTTTAEAGTAYAVTIGAGGKGINGWRDDVTAESGGATSAFGISAPGGGGGGGCDFPGAGTGKGGKGGYYVNIQGTDGGNGLKLFGFGPFGGGGGGGSGAGGMALAGGAGGAGGGGNGGRGGINGVDGGDGGNGAANTGGGAGGAGGGWYEEPYQSRPGKAGSGGSGVVIIRGTQDDYIPVIFNGTQLDRIIYNGVTLTSLIYNGTKLYCRKFRRTIKNLITANIAESRKKAEYV